MNAAPSFDLFARMPAVQGYLRRVAVSVDVNVEQFSDDSHREFTPEQIELFVDVLAAKSRDDLAELIEFAAADPRLLKAVPLTKAPDPRRIGENVFEDLAGLAYVFGEGASKPIVETGKQVARIVKQMFEGLSKLGGPAPDAPKRLPSDIMYDPTVPMFFRRAVEGTLRTTAALFVIMFAIHKRRKLEPWLAQGLADEFGKPLRDLHSFISKENVAELITQDFARVDETKITLDRLYSSPDP